MEKTLQDFIIEQRIPQKYRIKLLVKPTIEQINKLKEYFTQKYDLSGMSSVKKLPMQKAPRDFINVPDLVNVYYFDITFTGYANDDWIMFDVCRIFHVDEGKVSVRTIGTDDENEKEAISKNDGKIPFRETNNQEKVDHVKYFGNDFVEKFQKYIDSDNYKKEHETYKIFKQENPDD